MDLSQALKEKLTIPYSDPQEKDKEQNLGKRKGCFQVSSNHMQKTMPSQWMLSFITKKCIKPKLSRIKS